MPISNPIGGGGEGACAYGVAVRNGFVGTEEEWLLSLKGEKGDIGPLGPQGAQGETGIPGIQGQPGNDGQTGPQGLKGDKGDTGENGIQGIPGLPGNDGQTGAQGERGLQGPPGEKGDIGSQGLKGDIGEQGIQGLPGLDSTIPGPKGDKGDTGSQGEQGIQGIQGNPGANGQNAPVYALLISGTTTMAFGTNTVVKVTPNATATFTTTVPPAGSPCTLIILTSGTTSRTITFGTGFKPTGTLATGSTTSKIFVIHWISDGTNLYEAGRTAAITA
jgi:hypothetical protein